LQLVERDLLVLDDQVDLEHLDTVTDGDQLGETPDESVLLDRPDTGLEGLHVGLVVPRLDLHGDDRLGDGGVLSSGGVGSGLLVLLGLVGGDSLSLDSLGLGVVSLVVGTEEVDIVVLLLGTSSGGLGGSGLLTSGQGQHGGLGGVTLEVGVVGLPGGNVLVPSGDVGVGLRVGGGCNGRRVGQSVQTVLISWTRVDSHLTTVKTPTSACEGSNLR
jgi:hypothetical protein